MRPECSRVLSVDWTGLTRAATQDADIRPVQVRSPAAGCAVAAGVCRLGALLDDALQAGTLQAQCLGFPFPVRFSAWVCKWLVLCDPIGSRIRVLATSSAPYGYTPRLRPLRKCLSGDQGKSDSSCAAPLGEATRVGLVISVRVQNVVAGFPVPRFRRIRLLGHSSWSLTLRIVGRRIDRCGWFRCPFSAPLIYPYRNRKSSIN